MVGGLKPPGKTVSQNATGKNTFNGPWSDGLILKKCKNTVVHVNIRRRYRRGPGCQAQLSARVRSQLFSPPRVTCERVYAGRTRTPFLSHHSCFHSTKQGHSFNSFHPSNNHCKTVTAARGWNQPRTAKKQA